MDQAKGAASKASSKTTGTGKSVYDSVAANLQSARDASAKQLEDTRSAADQQWASLQKVCLLRQHCHAKLCACCACASLGCSPCWGLPGSMLRQHQR